MAGEKSKEGWTVGRECFSWTDEMCPPNSPCASTAKRQTRHDRESGRRKIPSLPHTAGSHAGYDE
ncbi:hypothetical protein HMPREF3038_01421 [Akkermansia sp. KLE1797]|nr:hypothetical protein HMPREF3038_01421 [Akkermansia sp. KLE1797]KXU55433.1 hypothetical protein HMPREF3039_00330 [Akkermansia sp. KLE1798]KZA03478.1 hypothetical protein HMPREF1326_02907 [Akkermansia sp. KLE1605]